MYTSLSYIICIARVFDDHRSCQKLLNYITNIKAKSKRYHWIQKIPVLKRLFIQNFCKRSRCRCTPLKNTSTKVTTRGWWRTTPSNDNLIYKQFFMLWCVCMFILNFYLIYESVNHLSQITDKLYHILLYRVHISAILVVRLKFVVR
jgi:hypothetical protein